MSHPGWESALARPGIAPVPMTSPAPDASRDQWTDLLSRAHAPSVAGAHGQRRPVVLYAFYVFIVATILPRIAGGPRWVRPLRPGHDDVRGSTAGSAACAALVARRGVPGAYRVAARRFSASGSSPFSLQLRLPPCS